MLPTRGREKPYGEVGSDEISIRTNAERIRYLEAIVEERFTTRDLLISEKFAARDVALGLAMGSLDLRLGSIKTASDTAWEALNLRLHGMNELRGVTNDVMARMLPRIEADSRYGASLEAMKRVELAAAETISRKEVMGLSDRNDARLKIIEAKISNWDGRLWAIGAAFAVMNALVAWVMAGQRLVH